MADAQASNGKRRRYRRRSNRANRFGRNNRVAKGQYPPAITALMAIRGPDGKLTLNAQTVEELARWGLPHGEMAALMGIALSTFKNICEREPKLSEAFDRGLSTLKFQIRHAQITTALEGNPTMQIWAGKTLLGQHETRTVDHNHSGTVDVAVEVRDQVRDKLKQFTKNREGPTQEDLDSMPVLPPEASRDVEFDEAEVIEHAEHEEVASG